MGTRRWWKRLDRWMRSQGLSREEVVRRSGNELSHVLPYFESPEPGARLRLFLELVEAAGGRLSALAGDDVAAAVEYVDLARQDAERSISGLADDAGLYRPHLNRILRSRQNMALETFDRLVTALGLWEALEIVPRAEILEVTEPMTVGGERWTAASGGSASGRPQSGRRLQVVGASTGHAGRAKEAEDTASVELREMTERLQRAELEREAALARAKRAERALARMKKRADEWEARVQEERERGDEAEQAAEEAAQEALEQARRADLAEERAAAEERRANRESHRANREHARAESESRRAAALEVQLRTERASTASERRRADEALRQSHALNDRLERIMAELRARPDGSSWLTKLGLAAFGAAAGSAATHFAQRSKSGKATT